MNPHNTFPHLYRSPPQLCRVNSPGALSGHTTREVPASKLEDFVQIALLARSLSLLRGGNQGRETSHWLEAAAFWRKQLSDPLPAHARLRH